MKRAAIRHQLNRMVDRRRLLARVEQVILAYAREHGATATYLTYESAQEICAAACLRGDHDTVEDCRRWMQLQPPRRASSRDGGKKSGVTPQ